MTKAQKMAENGSLEAEVYQAYIDNVGEEYAEAEDAEEAYQGQHSSDKDFAQDMADSIGAYNSSETYNWPISCIDWEHAASELMYDYFEIDGYYFRNL